MKELERLRWRCRRGLLELDILLARFLDRHGSTLHGEDLKAFDKLLLLTDNELLDQILNRQPCTDPEVRAVLSLLQDS
jgi:antitoxin CptB